MWKVYCHFSSHVTNSETTMVFEKSVYPLHSFVKHRARLPFAFVEYVYSLLEFWELISKIISENFEKYFGKFQKYYRNFWELFWKILKMLRIIAENFENYFGKFWELYNKISKIILKNFGRIREKILLIFSRSIFLQISRYAEGCHHDTRSRRHTPMLFLILPVVPAGKWGKLWISTWRIEIAICRHISRL